MPGEGLTARRQAGTLTFECRIFRLLPHLCRIMTRNVRSRVLALVVLVVFSAYLGNGRPVSADTSTPVTLVATPEATSAPTVPVSEPTLEATTLPTVIPEESTPIATAAEQATVAPTPVPP